MSVILYTDKNFQGKSLSVSSNMQDLKTSTIGYDTSSIQIHSISGALFFTKPSWDGRVMCRRQIMHINNVGDYGGLGKFGFNDRIKSLRITPFKVHVRYTVIMHSHGLWPGGYKTWSDVQSFLAKVHASAKTIWKTGFIDLVADSYEFKEHDGFFRIENFAKFITTFDFSTSKDVINVFFVDEINDAIGQAFNLPFSTRLAIAAPSTKNDVSGVARTLAHEIGHVFGLPHGRKNTSTLMRQTRHSHSLDLTDDQIEQVHRRLSVRSGPAANLRRE